MAAAGYRFRMCVLRHREVGFLTAIKSGLAVRILLTVAKVYAALWGCAALILVISVVSGLALDPLNRVWRELEDRRNR